MRKADLTPVFSGSAFDGINGTRVDVTRIAIMEHLGLAIASPSGARERLLRRRWASGIAIAVGASLVLEPRLALANAGTPLMWAGALHLMFGNAFIGLIEGVILALYWRVRWGRSILLMIAANYVA